MYVCICRQVTDNQLREFCRDRDASMAEVRAELGVGSDCGRCGKYARQIVSECVPAVTCKTSLAYVA